MTEQTITFTPQRTLMKGFYLILRGVTLIAKSTASILDASVRRWPYCYIGLVLIASFLTAFVFIRNARAERDAAVHKQYILQQQNEQLQIIHESKMK